MPKERRIILLGASNLAIGLPRAIAATRAAVPSSPALLVAAGHGRSWGTASTVLGRTLPGIVSCGLWEALARTDAGAPAAALVTDVGNDVAYGVPPETIAGWVRTCLDRLHEAGTTRIVITRLPLGPVRRLGRARFEIVRGLLFPGRRMTFADAVARAEATDAHLAALADGRPDIDLLTLPDEWYGPDGIHFRRSCAAPAWATMISRLTGTELEPRSAVSGPLLAGRIRVSRPERRWLLGREFRHVQPALRLPEGGPVGLY